MRRFWLTVLVLAVPRGALACPVCFGQSDSPMASAANLSIFVMLIITVAVLAGFATFFIQLIRRARVAEQMPAHGKTQEGTVQC